MPLIYRGIMCMTGDVKNNNKANKTNENNSNTTITSTTSFKTKGEF